jgi:hypothetical protein
MWAMQIPKLIELVFWDTNKVLICLAFFHVFVPHLPFHPKREMNFSFIWLCVMTVSKGPQPVDHNL